MSKEASLSTVIDADIKQAITAYCKRNGLKLRYVVEQALVGHIEDVIDAETIKARENEETVSLEDILAG